MNRRIPYKPGRQRTGAPEEGGGCVSRMFWLLVPLAALGLVWMLRTRIVGGASPTPALTPGTPFIATVTPGPPTDVQAATPVETDPAPTDPPLPTSTLRPIPSPTPTALKKPAPTQ